MMLRLGLLLLLSIGFWTCAEAQSVVPRQQFYKDADAFFEKYVQNGKVMYGDLKANSAALVELLKVVDTAKLDGLSANEQKAFYINAYNLTLIKAVLLSYPVSSPNDIPGMFDATKHKVAGEYLTLNDLENKKIRATFDDARVHFALVCGALSCPVITESAYKPESLDQQLETQTKLALNDPDFIRVDHSASKVNVSKIFEWYKEDFGGDKKSVLQYINKYRSDQLPLDYKMGYYTYDWTLNDVAPASNNTARPPQQRQPASAARYLTSSLLGKGKWELKIFNNIYTARSGPPPDYSNRGTYFSTFGQFLYGINPRLSIGMDVIYKANRFDSPIASWIKILEFKNDNSTSRAGLTAIGPKFKIAPFRKAPNISLQSSFMLSVIDDPLGREGNAYVDNGHHWWTQLFYDLPLTDEFSLFLEADLFAELEPGFDMEQSTFMMPLKNIMSYFPHPDWTIYSLAEFAPTLADPYVYYTQMGIGVKYLITPAFEIETLITNFSSSDNAARESTYNFGIRYTRL